MRKRVSASQVKRLPIGTTVYLVHDATGESGTLWIVKSGRKKLLKGILDITHEIAELPCLHYEIEKEGRP
jgi:hypothetical protein